MPRYKLINDKRVQLSAEEEALEDAKEKEFNDNSLILPYARVGPLQRL